MNGGTFIKEFIKRYRTDFQHRTTVVNTVSFSINVLIGVGKLILGVYLLSGWFITNAIYYLLLSAARGHALHRYTAAKQIRLPAERFQIEYAVFKRSGLFICLLGISYMVVSLRMYFLEDAVVYGGTIVFLIATIAFTKLGIAIYGITSKRHLKGPIVSTLKIFSFTDALVSIVVTQYTLLSMQQSPSALKSSALFGMGCSVLFICIGLYMTFKRKNAPAVDKY